MSTQSESKRLAIFESVRERKEGTSWSRGAFLPFISQPKLDIIRRVRVAQSTYVAAETRALLRSRVCYCALLSDTETSLVTFQFHAT